MNLDEVKNNEENFTANEIEKHEEIIEPKEIVDSNEKEVKPQFDEVVIKKVEKKLDPNKSKFDGKILELIGYNFLAFILNIFTLGIASSWTKCMVMSYKINHTVLNGKRLNFVGTGADLFINRLKWFFLTLITLGIYGFWVPIKIKKWEIAHIHFKDEEYIEGESFFNGKLIQLIGINFLCNFLNLISFGLLYPFTICLRLRWLCKHSVINKKKLIFKGKGTNLFLNYLIWSFLTIITFGIYGLFLGFKMIKWETKNSYIKTVDDKYQKDLSIIILSIVAIPLFGVVLGFIISVIANPTKFIPNNLMELFTGSDNIPNDVVDKIVEEYDFKYLDIDNISGYRVSFFDEDTTSGLSTSNKLARKQLVLIDKLLSDSTKVSDNYNVYYQKDHNIKTKMNIYIEYESKNTCQDIGILNDGNIHVMTYSCPGILRQKSSLVYKTKSNNIINNYKDMFPKRK